MAEVLVRMEGIEKTFPGVHALVQCQFELRAGEVHALVGENGAGKSTLMKVLTGIYAKDAGRITVKGQEVEIHNPKAALRLGISIIHQELNLAPHLTVAQNIFIGREPRSRISFFLDEKAINEMTHKVFERMHLKLDPRTRVSDLTVAKQQMVEIAKALSYNSDVLIMDEPTAALTESEIEELFRIIRQLKERGVGIVYISHRLEELKKISDRVTVMRDGRYIDTVQTGEVSIDRIISMMVGRTIYEASPEIPENPSQEVVLDVRKLNRGNVLKDVSFQLKRGEILGFAGLMGAGRTEAARAIFGADPVDSGEIFVMGKKAAIKSPRDAVQYGIGYLSEDRKRYGLTLKMDVESNIVLAAFKKFLGVLGWVNNAKTTTTARQYVKALTIKTPGLQQRVANLSGGNQQKVVVGKWLTADTHILIFDEPTRGIDVGAKSEIYHLLNQLTQQGKSIIMISSELPEILRMSHRVIVMCEGRITGEVDVADATQEIIMKYATQRGGIVNSNGVSTPNHAQVGQA
ncbi:MAG: sugar ABC transporter ATP-binding protein [Chloroflexi bacterium]|nr:sugar ABC transporter ATP-binding protein [Chloroflexota bacterium]